MKNIFKRVAWPVANKLHVSNEIYFFRNKYRLSPWYDKKYMFIHIPKNAGTSICQSLGIIDPGHYTYRQLSRYGLLDNKKIIFCVLRDPVQRITSIYNYSNCLEKKNGANPLSWVSKFDSLSSFVIYGLTNNKVKSSYFLWPQSFFIESPGDSRMRYIDFEDLNNGYDRISREIGVASFLPKINVMKKKDVSLGLNEKEKIYELYQSDVRLMNAVNWS